VFDVLGVGRTLELHGPEQLVDVAEYRGMQVDVNLSKTPEGWTVLGGSMHFGLSTDGYNNLIVHDGESLRVAPLSVTRRNPNVVEQFATFTTHLGRIYAQELPTLD
jgi:hypothetical protein